jgi:hypothetical protein
MAVVPFELRYSLNRRQRLLPHLLLWGPLTLLIPLGLIGLLVLVAGSWWALLLVLFWFWFFGNFFRGLLDVALRPVVPMDLRIEENGLGFLDPAGERWWIFLDGLLAIEQLTSGVWTLSHHNGTVIHIPAAVITDEQLAHLRAAMERGRTPEGIQAVIERGRRLVEMEGKDPSSGMRPPAGS